MSLFVSHVCRVFGKRLLEQWGSCASWIVLSRLRIMGVDPLKKKSGAEINNSRAEVRIFVRPVVPPKRASFL